MKILLTGAKGMLAQAVRARFLRTAGEVQRVGNKKSTENAGGARNLRTAETELILTDVAADENSSVSALDITNAEDVQNFILQENPDIIINCAAFTDVDGAESNKDLAKKVNADGPKNLATAAKKTGAILVHISTDYVFDDGDASDKIHIEPDAKNPRSVYGITKLAGENAIENSGCKYYIFRTAWLYGDGRNFVRTMMDAGRKNAQVAVVNDQFGSPTYAEDLVEFIYLAIKNQIPFGDYNATDEGFTNWADFTRKIFEIANIDCEVVGISSEEYTKNSTQKLARATQDAKSSASAQNAQNRQTHVTAPRPKNSRMSKQKLKDAGIIVPDWEESLKKYIKKEEND